MTKTIQFRNSANKTTKLVVTETQTQSKFVCYMRREDTGKSVTASGKNKTEAFNAALSKIKY